MNSTIKQEEIKPIEGSNKKKITLDITLPASKEKTPVVIFCHGFKGFKDWGHFNWVAHEFAKQGLAFLKFNFSHNGIKENNLTELTDMEAFAKNNYMMELYDLGVVIDFIEKEAEKYNVDKSKIYVAGHSRGGGIAILRANDDRRIKGLIVERGFPGFTTPETHGKWSLRASATGELVFDNVKVPKENMFPGVEGLKGPLTCLNSARYGISWGAVGAAMDCYDSALRYSKERIQFGKPIAGFQLQQKKLAEMITEITKAQLLCWRLGNLMNDGKASPAQISMAKRNNVEIAINIAREARQIHGGMGITGEYPIMRHMMNLESVLTYEGTHDVHLLILGMEITGENAFA